MKFQGLQTRNSVQYQSVKVLLLARKVKKKLNVQNAVITFVSHASYHGMKEKHVLRLK
jgi:hypothetical protein